MSRAKNTTHLFLVPKLYLGTRLPWKLCFRKGPGIVALAVRERRQGLGLGSDRTCVEFRSATSGQVRSQAQLGNEEGDSGNRAHRFDRPRSVG